jgi:hypothetical protein
LESEALADLEAKSLSCLSSLAPPETTEKGLAGRAYNVVGLRFVNIIVSIVVVVISHFTCHAPNAFAPPREAICFSKFPQRQLARRRGVS